MKITRSSSRDLPLDFVKGVLVIVMVIYHVMDHLSTAGPREFGYVRFVSGSFIFVSGYIISTFYEEKYRRNRADTSKRLFIRGVKLLIIFTALNLLINLTGFGNTRKPLPNIEQYMDNLTRIYSWGDSRFAAFQILLPISYLLMLSPVLLLLNRFKIFLIITAFLIVFSFSFLGIDSKNLGLGIVGLVGLSVGMAANGLKDVLILKNKGIISCCLIICVYLFGYLNRNLMTYSLGIMIVLKLTYELAKSIDLTKQFNKFVILLGQYTLVSYIMQILFLQILVRVLAERRWGLGYETMFIFIATNIFLLGLCNLVEYLRNYDESMNKAYRIIFS